MTVPKNAGTERFPLTDTCCAVPVPNNGVVLILNNTAIYLPFTALAGDPESGYHLRSTIIACTQITTPIDTSPPKKDEPCS